MMQLWALPYIFFYILIIFFWLVKTNRAILFWLYLWQLKEYHLGRFLDHFSTAKGKSLFLNPLFFGKLLLLIMGAGFFAIKQGAWIHMLSEGSVYNFLSGNKNAIIVFIAAVFIIFSVEALWAMIGFLMRRVIRPEITKKSILLLAASHILFFGAAIFIFRTFLGEMSLIDFAFASFLLLLLDVLLPLIVAIIVLALQPLTIWGKRRIMQRAKNKIAARTDLIVIGIAGSYGKSVTKELLASILSSKYSVLKTHANQNTEIGVAQTVINDLKPEHQIFVCEIGAVHKGRIKQVGEMVKPRIGILTGIDQQHLAVFGSQKNIIEGKFEILEVLPKDGIGIVNWQSRLIAENFEAQKAKIKTESIIRIGDDIRAGNIQPSADRLSFSIFFRDGKIDFDSNLRGGFMVEPILLAVGGALAAGMDFDEIGAVLNHTDFLAFNLKKEINSAGLNILNSTYSSNPDGVLAHLDYLKLYSGKKAVIMPCLIELGSASGEVHYQIGQRIGKTCDLAIITTKDRFVEIKNGAVNAGMKPETIIFWEKPAAIGKLIKTNFSAGDTILLEGRLSQNIINLL